MYLSASRIKAFLTCSWSYNCTYVLGLRHIDEGNDGSRRGTICHLILECIQKKPNRHYLIKDFPEKGFDGNKSIYRLVLKEAKKVGVSDETNMALMESFIKTGLTSDFLCEGWKLNEPEMKFSIENENPPYAILGFIDKSAISHCGNHARIDDYKTSKQKFSGKDISFNIQGLMYALALYKVGGFKKFFVNFIFLKFPATKRSPKGPLQSFEYCDKTIRGFEIYLSNIYKYLKDFNIQKACSNFARDNENYFLCGKNPGDLNKAGEPAWICPYKFGFLYWELKDKNGKIKFTAKEEQKALDKMEEGDTIKEKWYGGCVRWNKY